MQWSTLNEESHEKDLTTITSVMFTGSKAYFENFVPKLLDNANC